MKLDLEGSTLQKGVGAQKVSDQVFLVTGYDNTDMLMERLIRIQEKISS